MSSTDLSSIYFESSWSILSSIGLVNVFIGILVVGITRPSPITFVPIVVSAASAIADGLCYVAFYQKDNSPNTRAVASGLADLFWLIQETGLSMYNYQILIRILPNRERRLFKIVYWFLILAIAALKMPIQCMRIEDILAGNAAHSRLIDHLHIGYFLSIALVEIWSSYFLLKKFLRARTTSAHIDAQVGLFTYLMRSTELRLAGLSIIGISRAVTFSFQTTAQFALNVTGQIDRFVYLLECMFPIIMFIDILAAKTVVSHPNTSPLNDYKSLKPQRPSFMLKAQKTWPRDHSMVIERAHLDQWDEMSRYRPTSGIPGSPSSQDKIVMSGHYLEDGPMC